MILSVALSPGSHTPNETIGEDSSRHHSQPSGSCLDLHMCSGEAMMRYCLGTVTGGPVVDELISKLRLNSSGIKCLRQNKANLGSLSAKKPAYDNSLMAATHRSRSRRPL